MASGDMTSGAGANPSPPDPVDPSATQTPPPPTTTPSGRPRWVVARHVVTQSGLVAVWALFVAGVGILTGVVSLVRSIEASGMGLASQVPPWYAVGMGAYTTAAYLPLFVTHGRTRREVLRQLGLLVVPFSAVAGALMAAAFLLERGLYALTGWPQVLSEESRSGVGLFTAPDQYGTIFLAFLLAFLVYSVIGGFVGAAFYRRTWGGLVGLLMVPVGIVLAAPGQLAVRGPASVGILPEDLSAPIVAGLCLASFAVGSVLVWAFARDMPVRPRQ